MEFKQGTKKDTSPKDGFLGSMLTYKNTSFFKKHSALTRVRSAGMYSHAHPHNPPPPKKTKKKSRDCAKNLLWVTPLNCFWGPLILQREQLFSSIRLRICFLFSPVGFKGNLSLRETCIFCLGFNPRVLTKWTFWHLEANCAPGATGSRLGLAGHVPFTASSPTFYQLFGWEGSPTKIDNRKKLVPTYSNLSRGPRQSVQTAFGVQLRRAPGFTEGVLTSEMGSHGLKSVLRRFEAPKKRIGGFHFPSANATRIFSHLVGLAQLEKPC